MRSGKILVHTWQGVNGRKIALQIVDDTNPLRFLSKKAL